jgi:hypothetical protein
MGMGQIGNLAGKPKGKKSHGRIKRKYEYAKVNLKQYVYVDWIEMAQNGLQLRATVNIAVIFFHGRYEMY